MAVGNVKRLAGPFTGAGTKILPFGFKIFEPTDVFVALAEKENDPPKNLEYNADYSVEMNQDQEATPGGTVTLTNALNETQIVSVGTDIPYTQTTQLTNYIRFPPETINTALDRTVVQIQQLVEQVSRALITDPTDTITPRQLRDKLLAAVDDAIAAAGASKEALAACEAIKGLIERYSWDIPHLVNSLEEVEAYPFDGYFWVKGYGNPGNAGEEIGNRLVNGLELSRWFNDVKGFGAKGDGTTDDTVAFNRAATNGVVYVPAGTYRISNPYDLGFTASFYGEGILIFDDAEHRRKGGSSGSADVVEHYTLFFDYDEKSDVSITFNGVTQSIVWIDDYTIEAPGSETTTDVRIHIKNGRYRLGKTPTMIRTFNTLSGGGAYVAPSDLPAASPTGVNNVAFGPRGLEHVSSGLNNTAVGSRTLLSNTTAKNQTAIGFQALYRSNGDGNTAVGSIAGEWLTTGTFNSLYGCEAGKKLTTGSYNVAVGYDSLGEQQTGSYNTAVGYRASGNDGTKKKSYSTTVGSFAGDLSSGDRCTYIGYRAGCGDGVSLGEDNVAIGMFALRNVTSGQQNTVLGTGAASNLRTHQANVIVGFEAGEMATSSYNVIVGHGAGKAMTGGGAVIVGHAAAPLATGENNVAVGNGVAPLLTSGTKNVFLGANAGRFHLDGTKIETDSNSVFLGYDARSTGENQVQLGNSAQTTYAFGAVQDRSDARDKADVRDTILGSDFILSLRPVDFRWDMRDDYIEIVEHETEVLDEEGKPVPQVEVVRHEKDGSRKRKRYHHGLIAQEVRETMEKLGVDFGGYQDHSINGGCDVLSLGYEELIGPMIKTIQELNARIKTLEAKVL